MIDNLKNSGKNQILAMLSWLPGNIVYDYNGYAIREGCLGGAIAAIKDIDFDGYQEIIGSCGGVIGASVWKLNGEILNGFPNPPKTVFESSSIEDIDRDGNYDIIFVPYDEGKASDYHLGMYVLGSWGGLLPGFPVIFPFNAPWPFPRGPGSSYDSPSIGDFDDDGLMEIATRANNCRVYLIRSDGSHYRNWPIVQPQLEGNVLSL